MVQRILMYFILSVCISSPAFAQQVLNGRVVDENGQSLANATIVVKGTTQGTAADEEGKFKLEVANEHTIIVITHQGYLPLETIVGSNLDRVFTLQVDEEQTTLDEVVVIGYGTARKKDLTGAVSVINPKELTKTGASTMGQAMQGLATGVSVRNTGNAGADANIEIRGVGNLTNNAPLWVIDGMITTGGPDFNPNDVESMQILKDASAAAIYGSRAANGVI